MMQSRLLLAYYYCSATKFSAVFLMSWAHILATRSRTGRAESAWIEGRIEGTLRQDAWSALNQNAVQQRLATEEGHVLGHLRVVVIHIPCCRDA
eukprot:COSAG05_NODE_1694_length_4265_cov_73.510312_4_plen_94_part_00